MSLFLNFQVHFHVVDLVLPFLLDKTEKKGEDKRGTGKRRRRRRKRKRRVGPC